MVGALGQPAAPAVQGLRQFGLEVPLWQRLLHQSARRRCAACHPQDKQQALPLAQGHLRAEGGGQLIIILRDTEAERRDATSAAHPDPTVLTTTRDTPARIL